MGSCFELIGKFTERLGESLAKDRIRRSWTRVCRVTHVVRRVERARARATVIELMRSSDVANRCYPDYCYYCN